ncbi:MAG: LytTR family transcriptional regulator DNA-binding domain-containing protein [Bacteroidota bacterium]
MQGKVSFLKLINKNTVKGFSLGNIFWTSFFACVSHIFIDLRFEPYGFSVYPDDLKYALAAGYGIIMGLGFYFGHILIKNDEYVWPVWKEVIWMLSMVLAITLVNYFYRLLCMQVIFAVDVNYYVSFFRYILVGLEVAGSTALVFKFFQTILIKSEMLSVIYGDKDNNINSDHNYNNAELNGKQKYINGKNTGETLFFYPENLIYAKSQGNYIQLFLKRQNADMVEKKLLRLSMTGFLKQIEDVSYFHRVHKSFLINENYITNLNGNSKKARIILDKNIEIPLSRDMYKHYKNLVREKQKPVTV